MPDEPDATPTPPNGEPSMTTPAGAVPPKPPGPTLVRQAHGGALLSGGMPGNKGGGRPPAKLVEQSARVLGLTLDEFERRASDPVYLEKLSMDELRLVWQALAPYVLARRYEHSGAEGGPIVVDLEALKNTTGESLRRRLQVVHELGRPAKPAPEPEPATSTGTSHAAL